MTPVVRVAVAATASVGECPLWDADAGLLHWVDIEPGLIHSSDTSTGMTTTITVPTMVGAIALHRDGGFVAATTEGFLRVLADGRTETLHAFLPDGHRMNDAKCDPQGRFWAGSVELAFAPGQGALHVLDLCGDVRTVLDGLTLSNGLDWSPDGKTTYLIDSLARTLDAFDFDGQTGSVSGRRTIVTFDEPTGLADGMCVDADGGLWVAVWGGARVDRFSSVGDAVNRIELPAVQPSSCTFGGPDLDTLFVTTARTGLDVSSASVDGSVLAIEALGVRGLPARAWPGVSAPMS